MAIRIAFCAFLHLLSAFSISCPIANVIHITYVHIVMELSHVLSHVFYK